MCTIFGTNIRNQSVFLICCNSCGVVFYDAMFLLALRNPDYSFLVAKRGIHKLEELKAAMDTVEEVKQSVLDAIRLLKDYNTDENIPAILKGDYQIVYRFDTRS